MSLYFKHTTNIYFEISHINLNIPLKIKHNNLFLGFNEKENIVDFTHTDDNSGKQHWILEPDLIDEDIYYIKNKYISPYGQQYIGCPNSDNIAYLYTSKNSYTRWNILNVEDNLYVLKYVGSLFNIKTHNIVIARYDEDLNWIRPYNSIVTVYNKGEDDIVGFSTVLPLKNVGREGDTYLYHIVKNYTTLADRITFLQGKTLNHNHTVLFALDNADKLDCFQTLGFRWLENKQIPPETILNKLKTVTDYGLEYLIVKINNNLDYFDDNYFFDIGLITVKNRYFKDYRCNSNIIDHFLRRCKIVIDKPTDKINYSWSALFSTKKDNILKHDKDMYSRIKTELIASEDQAGADGYVLEKLWLYLLE